MRPATYANLSRTLVYGEFRQAGCAGVWMRIPTCIRTFIAVAFGMHAACVRGAPSLFYFLPLPFSSFVPIPHFLVYVRFTYVQLGPCTPARSCRCMCVSHAMRSPATAKSNRRRRRVVCVRICVWRRVVMAVVRPTVGPFATREFPNFRAAQTSPGKRLYAHACGPRNKGCCYVE